MIMPGTANLLLFTLGDTTVSSLLFVSISDAKCGIERNSLFIILKAEIFCRDLDRVGWLICVHIDL